MDIFEHIHVLSLGGMRSTLVIIDYFYRFTLFILLSGKDNACTQLIKFLKRVQNEKSDSLIKIKNDRYIECTKKKS